MKLPAPLLALAALASATCPAAGIDPGPVRITVRQESKSDLNKDTKVQSRTLKITLVNSGPDSLPLRVKYAFFGHAAEGHDTIIIDHSDLTTQLQPKSDQTLTTKTQTATFVDAHMDKKTKVKASGQRFTGWGVKVYQNGKVIAEACEPSSMLDDMATMPGLPEPKTKPAAKPAPAPPKPAPKPKPATPAPAAAAPVLPPN